MATIQPGNAQHHGARECQQDSFAFSDLEDRGFVAHGGMLGVVADGMGGLAHGGDASAVAVRAFLQRYESKRSDEPIPQVLSAALLAANAAVLNLARSCGSISNVGATLVAAVIHDRRLHWISVGDSRAYLLRDRRLEQLTLDHVYGAELDLKVAAGALGHENARSDPDREALTSHLGQTQLARVDRSVAPLPLEVGDCVLLCSDGLYRALSEDDIARHLATDPQHACEQLVESVVRKRLPEQDNVTAIALAIDGGRMPVASIQRRGVDTTRGDGSGRRRRPAVVAVVVALLSLMAAGALWQLRRHAAGVQAPARPAATATTTDAVPSGARATVPSSAETATDQPADGAPK